MLFFALFVSVIRQSWRFADWRSAVACMVFLPSLFPPTASEGGEPAQEFVNRLRAVGYFDTAIKYLDQIDRFPGAPQEFVAAIPLEKAQTHIDAAVAARSVTDRDSFFVSAEQELKKFLSQAAEHPRFSEARLQLAKLQLLRARQLMLVADPSDEVRGNARESFLGAAKTFGEIETSLRQTLEGLKGQRIDAAKEPEKAARRDQYRFEFLQALSHGAEAKQLAAQTYRDPATEGKAQLEEALTTFTELSDKYGGYLQGAVALLHRGQIQQLLGKESEALDSLQRALEQPDIPALRPARMQAAVALIEMRLAAQPPRIDEAIAQAQPLIEKATPDDRQSADFAALQVAISKAYFANAEKLKGEGKEGEARRMSSTLARPLLNQAVKIPGPHEAVAREMLASLGIETQDVDPVADLSPPKTLDEGLSRAREILQLTEELANTLPILKQRVDAGGAEAAAASQELDALQRRIGQGQADLIELLRATLALDGTDVAGVNQARQFLAYTLFQRESFWEAAAVGEFLARSGAGQPEGLRGGLIAISALQTLARDLPKDSKKGIVRQIELLGDHLIRTWPEESQAKAAKGILIRLALDEDRWDDARKLIDEMPEGPERLTYHRLMGQLLWNRSLLLRQENKPEEAGKLLPQAAVELKTGLDGISDVATTPEPLQAALVLAKVELRRGNAAVALDALDSPKYGPVKLIETVGEPSEGFKSDLRGAELQAVVGVMTAEGGDAAAMLARATSVMDQLRASVGDKPDANDRLVRIYLGLARDIRDQLDSASPDRKSKLIAAFKVFLDSIASSTKDPATLQWVGQTLMQLGESSMGPNEIKAQGQAAELLASATKTFEALRTQMGPDSTPSLKYQLGRANRLAGEYKQAIDLFEEILKATPMMLDAQIEAAKSYQQWAAGIEPKFATKAYESALLGARPGPDGKNVIWGWGKISKLISGKQEFRDSFFEARYQIALCRFMMGKTRQDNKLMEQAISDIQQVVALYPELGGEKRRRDFDLLMKEIQKSLGKSPDGLPPVAKSAS